MLYKPPSTLRSPTLAWLLTTIYLAYRRLSSAVALPTLTAYAKLLLLLLLPARTMLTLLLPANKTALVSGNRENGRLTLGDARRIPRYLGADPS